MTRTKITEVLEQPTEAEIRKYGAVRGSVKILDILLKNKGEWVRVVENRHNQANNKKKRSNLYMSFARLKREVQKLAEEKGYEFYCVIDHRWDDGISYIYMMLSQPVNP